MNQTEDRLRRAATETRQLADRQRPAPLPPARRPSGNRGWLVLAATFAVVLVVFGVLPLLLESTPDSTPSETSPIAGPGPTSPSTTSLPGASCSAAGFLGSLTGGPDVPEVVAATRAAIIDAAISCDFDTLESRAGEGFAASFGGGGIESLRQWEAEGQGRLGTLLEILHMSHEVIETEDAGVMYVWPAAYSYRSWDEIPADAIEELRSIHTPEEIESFEAANAYLGWRTAIDSDGRWLYFIAGD